MESKLQFSESQKEAAIKFFEGLLKSPANLESFRAIQTEEDLKVFLDTNKVELSFEEMSAVLQRLAQKAATQDGLSDSDLEQVAGGGARGGVIGGWIGIGIGGLVGSLVPAAGTAVGAGVGAGVGAAIGDYTEDAVPAVKGFINSIF